MRASAEMCPANRDDHMRIFRAIFGGMFGSIVGAVEGAAVGWAFDASPVNFAIWGALIIGGIGLMLRLLSPPGSSSEAGGRSEPKFKLEPCAWCRGIGIEGKKKPQPCSVCFGRGSLLTRQPATRCPKCKGKGRLFMGRRCKVCGGAGWEYYAHLDGATIQRSRRGRTRVAL